jgi:UDP-N-acetylglucosamine--dolichyl-phosphate N-acetylglucosaminephosphotransferase
VPIWIRKARSRGFVGRDVHKLDGREIPEMGGIMVIFSIGLSILIYIAFDTFIYLNPESTTEILAAVASLLIAAMIGMIDDILEWRIGIKQKTKVLLSFLIPLPLMIINAGHSEMTFPIIGTLDLGLLFPLLIVPIAIMGASNAFNMLAGYNGLEAGMGIIIFSTLGFLAFITGGTEATMIAVTSISALIAFLYYNRIPAKVFPGDTLTYPIGAMMAIVAILGNIEKYAAMLFFLYYIELILKKRGNFKEQSYGKLLHDGSLSVKDRIYSIPHIAILFLRMFKGKAYENEVVLVVLFFQIIISLLTILSFYWRF